MKNRWLYRRSCGLLVEECLKSFEKKFTREGHIELNTIEITFWKISMRHISKDMMEKAKDHEMFLDVFTKYLGSHNVQRAILFGEKLGLARN